MKASYEEFELSTQKSVKMAEDIELGDLKEPRASKFPSSSTLCSEDLEAMKEVFKFAEYRDKIQNKYENPSV